MRSLEHLDKKRVTLFGMSGDEYNGAFEMIINKSKAFIVASNQGGWEHVSVSFKNRIPTWEEMCYVKDLFFKEDEVVVQYHPRKEDYINNHKYCLHLWRPTSEVMPSPPSWMVGIK